MIKGSIQEEDITTVNTHAPNIEAPKYIMHILMDIKGEMDSNIITVGDFKTPLTSMDRSSRPKINKAIQALNDTLNHVDLIEIYREDSNRKQQNTHSFEVHMEHSPG